MRKVSKQKGWALSLSYGLYGGFYIHKGYTKRICLGRIALTYYPTDIDNLLKKL